MWTLGTLWTPALALWNLRQARHTWKAERPTVGALRLDEVELVRIRRVIGHRRRLEQRNTHGMLLDYITELLFDAPIPEAGGCTGIDVGGITHEWRYGDEVTLFWRRPTRATRRAQARASGAGADFTELVGLMINGPAAPLVALGTATAPIYHHRPRRGWIDPAIHNTEGVRRQCEAIRQAQPDHTFTERPTPSILPVFPVISARSPLRAGPPSTNGRAFGAGPGRRSAS